MSSGTAIPSMPFTWTPQNKTLLCSLATGPKHTELLRIMAPTAAYYALRHKMDCLVMPLRDRLDPSRPPAWDKVILIRHALSLYDTVIWIDADTIICDPARDIQAVLDPRFSMHLVLHPYNGKVTANTGVWICQNHTATFELLENVWNHTACIHHPWWEQAALMDLLGYDLKTWTFHAPTPYTHLVQYLDEEWNCRPEQGGSPVIKHFLSNKKKPHRMLESYNRFLKEIGEGGAL
ncbi:hypothetical protein [Paenibacillus sp. GCM10012303]|jgi:hypothetical protein|uniref:hypothetical protein n=1 Tax=Paenibacillus sp. GCM10012303 TaxID=3317340 RepID=UPI0036120650